MTLRDLFCNPAVLLALSFALQPMGGWGAVYHLDGEIGDDGRSGLSPSQAWRSLDRVNGHNFQPGDQLLLKAGTRYSGQLKPQGSGTMKDGQAVPIMIGSYGEGSKPRIDAEGRYLDVLLLRNVEPLAQARQRGRADSERWMDTDGLARLASSAVSRCQIPEGGISLASRSNEAAPPRVGAAE